MRSYRAPVSPL